MAIRTNYRTAERQGADLLSCYSDSAHPACGIGPAKLAVREAIGTPEPQVLIHPKIAAAEQESQTQQATHARKVIESQKQPQNTSVVQTRSSDAPIAFATPQRPTKKMDLSRSPTADEYHTPQSTRAGRCPVDYTSLSSSQGQCTPASSLSAGRDPELCEALSPDLVAYCEQLEHDQRRRHEHVGELAALGITAQERMRQLQLEISQIRNRGHSEVSKDASYQSDEQNGCRAQRKQEIKALSGRERKNSKANNFLIKDTEWTQMTEDSKRTKQLDATTQTSEISPSYAELLSQIASLRVENTELRHENQLLRKMVPTESKPEKISECDEIKLAKDAYEKASRIFERQRREKELMFPGGEPDVEPAVPASSRALAVPLSSPSVLDAELVEEAMYNRAYVTM